MTRACGLCFIMEALFSSSTSEEACSESFASTTYSEIRDHSLKSLLLSLPNPNKRQPNELPFHPLHMRAINHEWPLQAWHLNPQLHGFPEGHGPLTFQPA